MPHIKGYNSILRLNYSKKNLCLQKRRLAVQSSDLDRSRRLSRVDREVYICKLDHVSLLCDQSKIYIVRCAHLQKALYDLSLFVVIPFQAFGKAHPLHYVEMLRPCMGDCVLPAFVNTELFGVSKMNGDSVEAPAVCPLVPGT
jgi:hypothetical protein